MYILLKQSVKFDGKTSIILCIIVQVYHICNVEKYFINYIKIYIEEIVISSIPDVPICNSEPVTVDFA